MTSIKFFSLNERWWLSIAVICMTIIVLSAMRWIHDHPYGAYWDEALYLDQAVDNIRILHSGNLRHIGGLILIGDPMRPPAYRLLVLPFLAAFGNRIAVARFLTLAFATFSAFLIYQSGRRIAGPGAGVIAMLIFYLSTEVVSDSICFTTEGPLFMATAATLYFLFAIWSDEARYKRNWLGLGCAVGLGLLSKQTFALIIFPVLGFAVCDAYWRFGLRGVSPFLKGGLVALVIAAPWWILNVRSALGYAIFASVQPRQSLGDFSLVTLAKWLASVFLGLLGPGVSMVIGIVLVAAVWQGKALVSIEGVLNSIQKKAVIACACGVIPLTAAQLASINHNLRYLSPTVIFIAIIVGVLSEITGLARSRVFLVASGALLFTQVGMLVAPVLFPNQRAIDPGLVNGELPWAVMARFEQWDWKPVRDISVACGVESPKISYLGDGRAFCPPQIVYPWLASGIAAPEVNWLWRYEQGPLNWQKIMNSVSDSDIVLTAPNYVGQVTDKQDLDNQHNAQFAERLVRDPRFNLPIRLHMGRFEPIEVLLFLKKPLRRDEGRHASTNL